MRGNSASLGSRIHVAPVTAHRPKPSKAESAAAAQRARATARRALLLVVTVAVAVNLSYIMEHATSYLMSFYAEPEDRGDLIRYEDTPPEVVTYATLATRAPVISGDWDPSKIEEQVPVVFYYAKPGVPPCHRVHYTYKPVEQARRLNELVYFIGPEECRHFYPKMGVRFEHFSEYEDVYEWFQRNVGQPVDNHMRWFILKRFMEKHQYTRVFYAASEVMLYANITELAAFQYPKSDIVLPVRWPSLRPPLRPNQYVSTAVAGHAALFSYEGLADWCLFLHTVFRLQLFGGDPAAHPLVLMPQYNDMVPMGWYTFAECWMQRLKPPCLAEKDTGITHARAAQLRKHFKPRFVVESLCMPRRCRNSSWSDDGECAFDNNFSIMTATTFFKFRPKQGDKAPTSMHYAYYEAWAGEGQREPVQFLAVHFQGKKKEFLTIHETDPGKSWGGSNS